MLIQHWFPFLIYTDSTYELMAKAPMGVQISSILLWKILHLKLFPYLGFSIRGFSYLRFQLSAVYRGLKNIWKSKKKSFICFKTRSKRERAVTWNPVAQTRPLLESPSFVSVPTLPSKRATVLLQTFSLFELESVLSQFCVQKTLIHRNNDTKV